MKTSHKMIIIAAISLCFGMIIADINHRIQSDAKDYQLDVKLDSIYVYDDGKMIGGFRYGENKVLDSVILNDNQ